MVSIAKFSRFNIVLRTVLRFEVLLSSTECLDGHRGSIGESAFPLRMSKAKEMPFSLCIDDQRPSILGSEPTHEASVGINESDSLFKTRIPKSVSLEFPPPVDAVF